MNRFEIVGRLNWLKIQYTEKGTCITKIFLARKKPNANNIDETQNYESFPIVFFNTKNDNVAERIAEECIHGDYLHIVGIVARNKINTHKIENQIVGWNYRKVMWSPDLNKYVYQDNKNEVVGYGKVCARVNYNSDNDTEQFSSNDLDYEKGEEYAVTID